MIEVQIRTYEDLPLNRREILRYAGEKAGLAAPSVWVSDGTIPADTLPRPSTQAILEECLAEADGCFNLRICYAVLPAGLGELHEPLLVFAATAGLGIDRLIQRHSRLDPVKALYFQAVGAERVESLCDAFCNDMKTLYPELSARRSPGYGTAPLSLQREIFRILEPEKRIGVYLNERSLLMTPTKSVTAWCRIRPQT